MDDATLREFMIRDYPRLVPAVTLLTRSRASAEDAVLEAIARAWEASARGERIDSLPAWVMRVALNLSKNRLRRLRLERREDVLDRAHDDLASSSDQRLDVRGAIAKLPRRQREATVLRYYLDFPIGEIALAMGVSEGTAKTCLFRARHTLARDLGVSEEEALDDRAG